MNNTEFVSILVDIAKNKKTTYAKGCFGQVITENVLQTKSKQLPTWYANNMTRLRSFLGKNVYAFDCVCLIKAILWGWSETNCSWNIYKANGVDDFGDGNALNYCTDVSADMSNIALGELLWMQGHVGVYVGDGLVVECTMSWTKNVLISRLSDRVWLKHGKLKYVDYTVVQPQPTPVPISNYNANVHAWQNSAVQDGYAFPKFGCDGQWGSECEVIASVVLSKDMVKTFSHRVVVVQTILKSLGFYSGAIDGYYGNITAGSVKSFQKSKGFRWADCDGKIGKQTLPYILGVK